MIPYLRNGRGNCNGYEVGTVEEGISVDSCNRGKNFRLLFLLRAFDRQLFAYVIEDIVECGIGSIL